MDQQQYQQKRKSEFDNQNDNLRELLALMNDYSPLIPDAVTDYHLQTAGVSTQDVRVKRILGLAAQKFISDIASDAMAHTKTRLNKKGKGGKLVLQMDDLQSALNTKGVPINKPDYYT